jgi:biotin carboxyl carrier protein
MNKTFKAKVNGVFEYEITNQDLSDLDALEVSDSEYHILQNNKPYHAEIIASDFNGKSYSVKINNTTYSIRIANALDRLINSMGFAVSTSKIVNNIKAPMPGLILEINIKVGQAVKENDALLILEAMKMENIITSPRDGIIKSITAKEGDAVEKNYLLIEFE